MLQFLSSGTTRTYAPQKFSLAGYAGMPTAFSASSLIEPEIWQACSRSGSGQARVVTEALGICAEALSGVRGSWSTRSSASAIQAPDTAVSSSSTSAADSAQLPAQASAGLVVAPTRSLQSYGNNIVCSSPIASPSRREDPIAANCPTPASASGQPVSNSQVCQESRGRNAAELAVSGQLPTTLVT